MENLELDVGASFGGGAPLLQRLASYTASSPNTDATNHGIHPYPAKFIPQIPREIIVAHTNERNTVFDPFCGSGTTLLEACIAGRRSVGCDSNPIATLIADAKCTTLSKGELAEFTEFVERSRTLTATESQNLTRPEVKGLGHWFAPAVSSELALLKAEILKQQSKSVRSVLLCLFSSIIVSVSNQESETRYAAIEKSLAPGDVLRRFQQKARRALTSLISFSEEFHGWPAPGSVDTCLS
jgi:DNA methylase